MLALVDKQPWRGWFSWWSDIAALWSECLDGQSPFESSRMVETGTALRQAELAIPGIRVM